MINRFAAARHAIQIREYIAKLSEEINRFEEQSKEGLFRKVLLCGDREPTEYGPQFTVGWSGRPTPHLEIDYEEVTPDQAMQIAASAFWMVFESSRDMSDPGDRKTFERYLKLFIEQVRSRCNQRKDRIAEACTGHLVHSDFIFCPVHDK